MANKLGLGDKMYLTSLVSQRAFTIFENGVLKSSPEQSQPAEIVIQPPAASTDLYSYSQFPQHLADELLPFEGATLPPSSTAIAAVPPLDHQRQPLEDLFAFQYRTNPVKGTFYLQDSSTAPRAKAEEFINTVRCAAILPHYAAAATVAAAVADLRSLVDGDDPPHSVWPRCFTRKRLRQSNSRYCTSCSSSTTRDYTLPHSSRSTWKTTKVE